MTVVSAFLVPGSPLPLLRPDNPPWQPLADGYRAAALALADSAPDVIAVYSTQWLAVLDELWQARARIAGVHVDENWHELGDLPFDIRIDTRLTKAVIARTPTFGVRSKGVDYDGFPVDTGTIVADRYLNPRGRWPLVIASNNVYHDWNLTEQLARALVECAAELGRRVALVGVGGLSGTLFREDIDPAADRIAEAGDDRRNRRLLKLLERGDGAAVRAAVPRYAAAARADMGLKHLAWLLGGAGERYRGAKVHAYGPTWGAGAAVVELVLAPAPARRRPGTKKQAAAKKPAARGGTVARKTAGGKTAKNKATAGKAAGKKTTRGKRAAKKPLPEKRARKPAGARARGGKQAGTRKTARRAR